MKVLAQYKTTEAPFYGLRELRAGPLAYWMLAYNILATEKTILEALARISRVSSFKPRQNMGSAGAITAGLIYVLASIKGRTVPANFDEKAELENYLLRYILKVWRRRRSIATKMVQPLSCFVDSELELMDNLLRFPSNSADCVKGANCGAAMELKKRQAEVEKIVEVLRPPKQLKNSAKKETDRRRGALKAVLDQDADEFLRKDCRAIGDAYFCIMAPAGADILTTNRSDFEPMAKSLGKNIKIP